MDCSRASTRDSGIDAVKLLAIVFVIVHHVVDFGFVMPESAGGAFRFVWYLVRNVAATCIDLFALATGYLCVTSSGSVRRLPALWVQAVFTGAAVCLLCQLAGVHAGASDWLRTFLPVVTGEYWYFTAYFGVCLVSPFVNPGARGLGKTAFFRLLGVLFLCVSVPSILVRGDPFVLRHGYSFAWLLILYLFGAYWRLHVPDPPRASVCWLVLGGCSLSFLIPSLGKRVFAGALGGWFAGINPVYPSSPTMLAMALAIFGLCRHVRLQSPRGRQVLASLSGLSFGMYLWLVHPVFWRGVWQPCLHRVDVPTMPLFFVRLLLASSAAFLAAGLLESARKWLFRAVATRFSRRPGAVS